MKGKGSPRSIIKLNRSTFPSNNYCFRWFIIIILFDPFFSFLMISPKALLLSLLFCSYFSYSCDMTMV